MSRLHDGLHLQRMTDGQGNFIGDLSQSLLVSVLCGLCVIVVYGQDGVHIAVRFGDTLEFWK